MLSLMYMNLLFFLLFIPIFYIISIVAYIFIPKKTEKSFKKYIPAFCFYNLHLILFIMSIVVAPEGGCENTVDGCPSINYAVVSVISNLIGVVLFSIALTIDILKGR